MSETNKRGNRPHGITIRFTQEEYAFIEWFSKRMDTDKSNVPRMLMSLYQTDHAELMSEYYASQPHSFTWSELQDAWNKGGITEEMRKYIDSLEDGMFKFSLSAFLLSPEEQEKQRREHEKQQQEETEWMLNNLEGYELGGDE